MAILGFHFRTSIVISLSSLLLLLSINSVIASSDNPFTIAHKKATLKRLKSGSERVIVSIDIYNQGSATAYDVGLIDDSWPKDSFNVINGKTSNSWERLDAGAQVSVSFELEAKAKGKFHGAPALIRYHVPTKADLQQAFSSPIFPFDILDDRPPEKKLDLAKRFLGQYGSVTSAISIVVLFIYLVASPSSSVKANKKRH